MTREEAIRILASSCISGSKQTEALETLIPELRESEDERIRKFIVWFFNSYVGIWDYPITKDKCLAWLEKQKEQKPAEWSEEEPKEWSEEDEKIRRNLMSLLANMRGDRITEETYQKYYPWLKSLRPQTKQEWSEEDEACIRNLESIIYYDKKLPNDTRVILGEFLSNLRPQPKRNCKDCAMFLNGKCTKPHWKPSEEQMKALQIAAMESKTDFNTLTSLLADLMKL